MILGISGSGKAELNLVKSNLNKIKWIESSPESKDVVSSLAKITDSEMALVTKHALSTPNVDLISFIRSKIEEEDWEKERTWHEGLALSSRAAERLEVLGKWNSSAKENFGSYFLNAPDVPYEIMTHWHAGFLNRGLQGAILKIMAKHDEMGFKKMIALLNEKSVSLSKKRTIVWAMRYDHSGFSGKFLKSMAPGLIPKEDIDASLRVLSLEKQRNLR